MGILLEKLLQIFDPVAITIYATISYSRRMPHLPYAPGPSSEPLIGQLRPLPVTANEETLLRWHKGIWYGKSLQSPCNSVVYTHYLWRRCLVFQRPLTVYLKFWATLEALAALTPSESNRQMLPGIFQPPDVLLMSRRYSIIILFPSLLSSSRNLRWHPAIPLG